MTNLKNKFGSQELLTKTVRLFTIFFLVYAGMIFWTPPFNDDVARMVEGYHWSNEGRVLATFLYRFLTGTFNLIFLATPALQLIALLITAYSTLLLTKIMTGALRWTNIAVFSTLAIFPFSNIFFIYQFDSIYFSVAVFLAILPFYLKDELSTKKWFILATLSLLGIITSYPPVLNSYLVLSAYVIALKLKESNLKKVIKVTLFFAIPFITAYVIYVISKKTGILKFETDYVQKWSRILTLKEIFSINHKPSLLANMFHYLQNLAVGLTQSTMGVAILTVIGVFYSLLIVKIVKMRAKLWYKIFLLFFGALTIFVPVAFELFLTYSSFIPRHMIAWNIAFGIMLFIINESCQKKWLRQLAFLATGYTLLLFAVFPSISSSASREQTLYNQTIKQSILADMTFYERDTHQKIETVIFEGYAPYAPNVRNALSHYPQLKLTVRPEPQSWIKEYFFKNTYRADTVKVTYAIAEDEVPKELLEAKILYIQNAIYDFYTINDTTIYIEFRPSNTLRGVNAFFKGLKTRVKKVLGK